MKLVEKKPEFNPLERVMKNLYPKKEKLKLEVQKGEEIVAVADSHIDREGYYERSLQGKVVISESQWNEFVALLQELIKKLPRRNYPKGTCVGWVEDVIFVREELEKILEAMGEK